MKWAYSILITLFFGITAALAEKGINYQAVARNAAGDPIVNSAVSLKFTVHNDSSAGSVAYQETHITQTNSFGVIAVVMGGGIIINGNLDSIDWSGNKYLQVEYDYTGGTNFVDMGTSEMLGAPFASFAHTASFANASLTAVAANHAIVADSARTAAVALQAQTAITANRSLLSDSTINASHAQTAQTAGIATTALTANHSLTSDNALSSNTSLKADSAVNAVHAQMSETAVLATTALTANTALTSSGITSYYAESIAQSSTTSSSYQDKVTLTIPPGTYILTFSAMVASTGGLGYKFDCGTSVMNGIPMLSGVATEFLSVSNTVRMVYTTATTLKIQYSKNQSGGATAYIQNATISAIPTN